MTLLGEMLVEDGMQKGRLEGRREGRLEGELLKLVSLIRKKMLRGCQEEQIADLLEEDIQTVEKICRTVSAHPEEDDQGICQLLMESEKTECLKFRVPKAEKKQNVIGNGGMSIRHC